MRKLPKHCLSLLVVVVIALALWPGVATPAIGQNKRLMVGYYVPWDGRSWAALQANAHSLDIVATQTVQVDPCGSISTQDDQTLKRFARERGIAVFPSVVTFSGWLNNRLLTIPEIRDRLIADLAEYVVAEDYEGFDLDLEGVNPADRPAYTSFVESLAAELHARGKRLSLALAPKTRDVTTGWAGAYDYAALGQHADHITIMTYEFSGPWGDPGPIAPAGWVDDVIAFATSQIPSEKVLLGLAFYGYDWNEVTGSARALGYAETAALVEQHGTAIGLDPATQSGTFRYESPAGSASPSVAPVPRPAHEITRRTAAPCDVQEPPRAPTRTPRPSSPPGTMESHTVWIEEAASAAARLQIAERYRTGGVAAWRLGQDDPAVWPVLERWRASER